jgi:hypothetical protein
LSWFIAADVAVVIGPSLSSFDLMSGSFIGLQENAMKSPVAKAALFHAACGTAKAVP